MPRRDEKQPAAPAERKGNDLWGRDFCPAVFSFDRNGFSL